MLILSDVKAVLNPKHLKIRTTEIIKNTFNRTENEVMKRMSKDRTYNTTHEIM